MPREILLPGRREQLMWAVAFRGSAIAHTIRNNATDVVDMGMHFDDPDYTLVQVSVCVVPQKQQRRDVA